MLVFNLGLNLPGLRFFSFTAIRTRYVQFIFQFCFLDAIFWLITVLGGKSAVIPLGAIDGVFIIQYRSKGRVWGPGVRKLFYPKRKKCA